jgi:hypothetical protein
MQAMPSLALHPPNVSIRDESSKPEAGQWLVSSASARLLDWIKLVGLERTKPCPPWTTTNRCALPGIVAFDPVVERDVGFEDFRQYDKRTLVNVTTLVNTLAEF